MPILDNNLLDLGVQEDLAPISLKSAIEYLRNRSHPAFANRLIQAGKVGVALIHFNTMSVASLPVPLPPSPGQKRIMEEVAKRLSVTDEVEIGAGRQLHCADRLRQAILKRAFEGKLVPQDPNDEPASVLLERIRAKRVITNNIANPRRGRSMRKKATHA